VSPRLTDCASYHKYGNSLIIQRDGRKLRKAVIVSKIKADKHFCLLQIFNVPERQKKPIYPYSPDEKRAMKRAKLFKAIGFVKHVHFARAQLVQAVGALYLNNTLPAEENN